MMTMLKRITFGVLLAAVLAIASVLSPALQAQMNTAVQTTLSAALVAPTPGTPATLVSVASASSISGPSATFQGTELFVDSEAMLVTAVSGTNLTVVRGYDGTTAVAHKSGAIVYAGPNSQSLTGSPFVYTNPPLGDCSLVNEAYPFRVNVRTGMVFACVNTGWRNTFGPANFPWGGIISGQTAGTTTTALGAWQSGSTVLFDAATGNNFILPAPVAGMTFDFLQTTTVTSNSSEIQTNSGSVFIQGSIQISGVATTLSFACNGTSHIAIKQNGTTTGGILGGRLHFVAVSTTKWQVDGFTNGSGTGATPCSTTT